MIVRINIGRESLPVMNRRLHGPSSSLLEGTSAKQKRRMGESRDPIRRIVFAPVARSSHYHLVAASRANASRLASVRDAYGIVWNLKKRSFISMPQNYACGGPTASSDSALRLC